MNTTGYIPNKIKLLCFPYAGGSSSVYNKFNRFLDENIEIIPIEYSGRGKRVNEGFYPDIPSAIEDIYNEVIKYIKDCKFAVYGHSMGTVIVYEVCKKIKESIGREPEHIFISGRYPPHINKDGEVLHTLPDQSFIDEIMKIGGTPREVFENKDIARLFIPILRADYKLIELYTFKGPIVKFNSGITIFDGKDDCIVSREELLEWQQYSSYGINMYEFEGGHFFINDYVKEIDDIINCTLINSMIPV